MLTQILFVLLSGLAILAAIGVVAVRNTVYGALYLGLCFAMIGGLYGLLGADFLFGAQILIYVGAIAVLFLFVVLLSGRKAELAEKPLNETAAQGVLAAAIIFALMAGIAVQVKEAIQGLLAAPRPAATTQALGDMFLGEYALGMEILGLMLLVSLVGATLLAKGWGKTAKEDAG